MRGCRPLSNKEVSQVKKYFAQKTSKHSKRNLALFLLGVKAGFRISEILSLRLKDVFDNGEIARRVTVARRNMKRKLEGRSVILNDEARQAIAEHIQAERLQPADFLFKSQKSQSAITKTQAYRLLISAFRACGIAGNTGTHSMRKTFAANIHLALGGDVFKTQQALGQKNISSTICYLSFREDEIEKAIEAL